MWHRDPVEVVRELLGNPSFQDQGYAPIRIFKEFEEGRGDGKDCFSNREYSEMWTADWWWEIQELLPIGATLSPIIISSDKTQLTHFSGDKQAWPVYISVGNLRKATRRTTSSRATILLGYIPVTKLEIFSKENRSREGHQLFHDCVKAMLEPLKEAGEKGVLMDCADGFVRHIFPILSAYIADYPEQTLVACCRENSCPKCLVTPLGRGDTVRSPPREPTETLRVLKEQAKHERPIEYVEQNLRPINPFWEAFPHCDIFSCMTPDALHELHNGVFGDHIIKWANKATRGGSKEIDARFRALPPHPTLRHFKKGISLTTQWTGKEHKNMEKTYLGILAKATDPAVQRAVRGILDFIHYAHFEVHSDDSLARLDAAWAAFHSNKQIFVSSKIRKHFRINKLHKLKHYVDAIRSRGTADGFNTENTERLHIDLAKAGYNASNRVAYTRQMAVWLARQEAVHRFGTYLQWAMPGYIAQTNTVEEEEAHENETNAAAPLPPVNVEEPDLSDDADDSATSDTGHRIAKKPPFPDLTATSIETDFRAPDFLYHLDRFLQSKSIDPTTPPIEASTFPVYKRFSIMLPKIPAITSHDRKDVVRAVRGEVMKMTEKGVRQATAGQFDTVLVRTAKPDGDQRPTDGLSVARVRVIFCLPAKHGIYPDPLAYVDWYKPLNAPVPDIGMHEVSLSSRNHRQKSSIIPITAIFRSCHLIPVFGRAANPTWTSDRVLDQCKSFYVNPYLRHHDFFLFRYLVDTHNEKKAEQQRQAWIRQLGRAGRF
ncbi:hypothetical protein FB45DRAFT_830357 [Roridomyces roridus]|uniref:Transposase n=1 Tax=Roridomyces roridus TaxID=1738132 RepID=A0AAD7FRC1_9AGAR|nr:hypothetical protein FB45DRAFT_830357 [Roridomyces roridus]